MATPLTDATADRVARLFASADRDWVAALLLEDCGEYLSLLSFSDSAAIERIRFAVLKLSGGDLNALQRAVDLAKTDWRDVRSGRRWCSSAPSIRCLKKSLSVAMSSRP
jgi:hypothetical protein